MHFTKVSSPTVFAGGVGGWGTAVVKRSLKGKAGSSSVSYYPYHFGRVVSVL